MSRPVQWVELTWRAGGPDRARAVAAEREELTEAEPAGGRRPGGI